MTTWRKYIQDNIDRAEKELARAKQALSEDDCLGVGVSITQAEMTLNSLGRRAYDVMKSNLDVRMDRK